MKTLFKWLGRSILALLVLLLIVGALAGWLLGTDRGFRTVINQVSKRVAGLQVDTVSGNLVRGIASDEIGFSSDALDLTARGLDSSWRLSCLMQREFCLDRLVIDELMIETHASRKEPAESAPGPIELPDIVLPVDITIEEILVRTLRFQAPGDAPEQVLHDIHLAARTSGSDLLLDDFSLAYQDYHVRAAGEVTLRDDYPLNLTLNLDAADLLPDSLPEGEGAQPASVVVQLDQTLRDLRLDTQVTGAVEASLSGQVKPLEPTLPATLTLQSDIIGWPLASRKQIRAEPLRLDVDGTLDDYRLRLSTDLVGEQVPATAISLEGQVNTERVTLPDIDIRTLGGNALASAEVSWHDQLQWQTSWQIENIDPSLQAPEVSGNLNGNFTASGRVENGNWTLSLPQASINGTLRDHPFTLDAKLSRNLDNTWQIDRLLLNNQANRIDASGSISDSWNLTAAIRLPQLQNLLPSLDGGFNADLSLAGPLATPDIEVQASSSRVQFNDIEIQGISVNADIAELFLQPGELVVAAGTVKAGAQEVNNARLALRGTRESHTLTLYADGPQATAIDLLAGGSLNPQFDWSGVLDRIQLEIPAHDIALNQPTAVAWNNTTRKLSVDPHCWVTEGSNLCLENRVVAENSGTATVTLDRYALNRLNPFLPAESTLQGDLRMNASIAWGEEQPGGFAATINTAVEDGAARVIDADNEPVYFRYEQLTLDTRLNAQSIDATLTLRSENLGQASAQIRMDPSTEEKPIEGTLSLDGLDIGIAQAFLPDFDEISGTISLNGELSGQLSDPRFNGELVLDEPTLRAEILPLPLTGGQLIATIKGKRAVLDGVLNSDEGRIEIDGSANWQVAQNWRADVGLSGEDLNLQSDPLQESTVNHQIDISARPGIIRVTGDIDIPMARIDVAELPQGAAGVSDDVVIIEDIEDKPAEDGIDPPGETQLQITLAIALGDDVSLSAYGLETQLTGDMTVRMVSPRPVQLAGEINVVDGIYKKYGQDLEANGQILFVGPVDQTRLAIDAVREIDSEDRIAGLRIQGTVESPKITLFTVPDDKSEDAILSYIVLGRDINETSDQEANLLAAAALALTVRGGRTIGSGIADALGVEDFALETRGSGDDTELVVSGRLNDRLLLRYGRSVFEPSSTLYLRYDLTKKLYLEAAQGTERAVDLFYSFSF